MPWYVSPIFLSVYLLFFLSPLPAQPVYRLEKHADGERLFSSKKTDELPALHQTDILHYQIQLAFVSPDSALQGRVKILLQSKADSLSACVLHLHGLHISRIVSSRGEHSFTRDGEILSIELTQYLSSDDTLTLQIDYSGRPENDGFGGYFAGDEMIYTVGEGLHTNPPAMTRYWLPCKDVPWDKAPADFELTIPQPFFAVANGLLEKIETDSISGRRTFFYTEKYPVATYLLAFAISDYEPFSYYFITDNGDSIESFFYVSEPLKARAKIDFSNLPQMMRVFTDRFGPYSFERYGMAVAPMRGAMEHQTITTYSSFLLTGDNRYDFIVAHELAHQWWGDWVTLTDWNEIWLNEGFASYAEVIYLETVWSQVKIRDYLWQKANSYFEEVNRLGHFPLAAPDYLWGGTVYDKGAWVLHMLRNRVGDEKFWQILQNYGRRFAYGNATIADFIQVVNETTGENPDWFFNQWIYAAGYPELKIEWSANKIGTELYSVVIALTQIQESGTIFRFPLEIAIVTPVDTVYERFDVATVRTEREIKLTAPPVTILADPQHKVLLQAQYFAGRTPREPVLLQNYPNPFYKSADIPQTTIEFTILKDLTPAKILIYNSLGRQVRLLQDKILSIGRYKICWDGKDHFRHELPDGIYFYMLQTPAKILKNKLVLIHRK